MQQKTKTVDSERNRRNNAAENRLPPTRTSDESPAGAQHMTRKLELRDSAHAPGQLPIWERKDTPLDADERYGQTIIPLSVRPKTPSRKRVQKRKSPRRKS
jgi:hypothetical protein